VREEEVIIAGTTGLELDDGARADGVEVVLVMDGGQADVQYVAPLQFSIETEAQQPPKPTQQISVCGFLLNLSFRTLEGVWLWGLAIKRRITRSASS
jgi:hypothetical protein